MVNRKAKLRAATDSLIELIGFAFIVAFTWFVWPPLVLLVAGLLFVLWANVRAGGAWRPEKDKRTDLRRVA